MAIDDIPKKISSYSKVRSNFELPWGPGIIKPSRRERERIIRLNCLSLSSFSASFQSLEKRRRITADSSCWYHVTWNYFTCHHSNYGYLWYRQGEKALARELEMDSSSSLATKQLGGALDMCHPLLDISLPSINSSSMGTRSSNPFS